jgi:1-acyl-sn-glycerol-3-phosphate acyltransferase
MIGTYEIQPPGKVIPKFGRVGVRFGKPLDFSRYYQDPKNVEVLRKVTNEIMQAIHKLSGQEYVDIYATNAKELLKKGKKIQDELNNKEGI